MRLQETLKGEPAKQLAEMFPPFGPGFPRTTIEGEHLHIVAANRVEPEKSEFRCECCQDDWEEKFG